MIEAQKHSREKIINEFKSKFVRKGESFVEMYLNIAGKWRV